MSTSAPAPEPRSSTVSPSCRSATAVGTPQPSEALSAASGRLDRPSASSYRAEPKTTTPVASVTVASEPQHELPVSGPQPQPAWSGAAAAARAALA